MRGFSTLEMIIAIAIMASTLSAVVLVSFGNQALLGHASANAGAVERAQILLESAQTAARQDFRLVHNIATTSADMYRSSLSVSGVEADPYTTKRLTAITSWYDETHTTQSTTLSELVTDFEDPSTLDTCDSSLTGNWTAPSVRNFSLSPGNMLPTNSRIAAVNTIGAVDAYHGKLYVADATRSAKTNDSFFIFDLSNPISPTYLGSIDTAASTTDGVNAIVVAGDYAYVASAHGANFKTCKPAGNCSQLQILNIADPSSPALVRSFLLSTSSAPFVIGSGGQAIGNTLFYKDGYIYMGLAKTSSGPEFDIVDVRDPVHPVWVGGYAIGATVNQIYVRSGYAYLATDDQSRKLIVLDVRDPANVSLVSNLDPHGTSNQEYGYSMYMVGDQMFLGMSSTSVSGSPEFASFTMTDPAAPMAHAALEVGASVLGIFVRDARSFLLTSIVGLAAQFQMIDTSDPTEFSTVAPAITLPGTGASMDCEENYFYIATNNGSQGNISVIGPGI